ncbi:DUF7282 domain-containing protein [Haloferax larsenii]|uniref:PGF-CTERM protein n=1 Tax=Haloferax larsenii TaxID=302484 RepID=A0A1H7GXB0_HALLR|nr:hypothetical protein [Haloferax larsenii]SEK42669.1 hypothetical protein SAMN04488691_101426 [Haloferax larsenii]
MSYAVRIPSLLVAVMVLVASFWVPVSVVAADGPSASFEKDVTTVTRGDEVEIQVSHSESGTLHIGGDDYGYHLTVELTGSGTTTVTVDTYNSTANNASDYISGGGAKNLTTAPLDEPIEPSTYLMNVTIGGVERAIGQLKVTPRGNTSAETHVAPASLNESDDGISADSLPGSMTKRQMVAKGDYAVIKLNESGLESALKPDDISGGPTANGIKVSMNQLEVRPNHEQETFLATPENGATVVEDLENDLIYVVWDTSDLPLEGDTEEYEVTVTLEGENNSLVEEDTITARSRVELVEPTISIDVHNETTYPWEALQVNVTGETTIAPNSVLEVRARAPGQPFLKLVPVTVSKNGTLRKNLTFAPEDRGLSFPLWVRGDYYDLRDQTETKLELLESDAGMRFVDQETDGTYVTVSEVTLSVGGFVRVETADEEPLGTSAYLPPGTHENVIVEFDRRQLADGELLAVAHTDQNRDENFSVSDDPPYRTNGTNGSIVADDAMVRLEPDAKTPTPNPTTATSTEEAAEQVTATATATPYPVTERTPLEPSGSATNTGIPLSPGLVVVALVVTGLLARRRQ